MKVPSVVMTTTDKHVIQMAALLNAVLDDLIYIKGRWNGVIREASWTSTGVENQGVMTTLAPGFRHIVPESFYDRTASIPISGPISSEDWQRIKATAFTAVYSNYRIMEGMLKVYPVIENTHTLAFEYKSDYAVESATAIASKYFNNDTDTCVLDDTLLIAGLTYFWKKEKGLAHEFERVAYENITKTALGQDGKKQRVDMGESDNAIKPGIFIPDGNWPL